MRKSIEKRARLRGDNDFMPSVADGGDFSEFKSKRCPDCGMTEDEFTETGRLGCEYCYEAFYDLIATRTGIARGLRHTGSKPGEKTVDRGEEYRDLQNKLRKAVEDEDYAAVAK
ncbi:MAG: hypothetical protein ACLUSP_02310 [Christensenellales bacterium]